MDSKMSPPALYGQQEGKRTHSIENSSNEKSTSQQSGGGAEEALTYVYEPQGELLQAQHDLSHSTTEFVIPHLGPVNSPHPGEATLSNAGAKRKIDACRTDSGSEVEHQAKRVLHNVLDARSGPDNASQGNGIRSDRADYQSNQATGDQHIRTLADVSVNMVLPPRRVFPIQIGDRLFRLSGASISSDAPSYFSHFFETQIRQGNGADDVRTLYIDRDPATFEDISLHLQGYHVEPRDSTHYVKLFADAQFFSLQRLISQLCASPIYIRIGETEFRIPRDLFNGPGDSPNYFSLGFAMFLSSEDNVFPGLSQSTLLRPPPISPPSVPNKSARTFNDLLHIVKGYPVEIRNEQHRNELLRDARYFHLKGLEQRLIAHHIAHNYTRQCDEITVRLEDIRPCGLSVVLRQMDGGVSSSAGKTMKSGWINYQRPHVDQSARELIIEISEEDQLLLLMEDNSGSTPIYGKATLKQQTLVRMTSVLSALGNIRNLKTGSSTNTGRESSESEIVDGSIDICIEDDADVTVDGGKYHVAEKEALQPSGSKRKQKQSMEVKREAELWTVLKSQWRISLRPIEDGDGLKATWQAVKLIAVRSERERNALKDFLT
ncbi:Hypothetical protein R9X50_00636200 [Acrodontium crateriforme]|uniref:Potassium channel tetramerisation-type BTB domain-containing protein n=1 Tax=Acrodontium crateriforme TaxID=150365 RepID=A0AAQ3MD77_9PEZI|nr:Hypothetical protein R9X50_00636200 [Acrodontium crateriforme]